MEQALDRLSSQGYLDDRQTASLWVEQQLARKPQGPRKLLSGLLRRGVDSDLAHHIVSLQSENETALAKEAATRWLARTNTGDRAGLARHLDRLGFRTGTAVETVQGLRDQLQD